MLCLMTLSCNKDEDTAEPEPKLNKSQLYDKWWYPSDGAVISDMYFDANGDYSQEFLTLEANGTWNWVNGSDTMFITTDLAGSWYQVFTSIEKNSMAFKLSVNNYSTIYKYSDSQ